MLRRLLFIPVGMMAALIFSVLLTIIFVIEVYLDEIYDGPLKSFLVYL